MLLDDVKTTAGDAQPPVDPVLEAASQPEPPVISAQGGDTGQPEPNTADGQTEPVVDSKIDVVPEPTYHLPGQQEDKFNEADWLRQQYAQALQQLQVAQQQAEELRYKDLPEDERAALKREAEVTQLRQYVQQIQQQQAVGEWRGYWSQFVEDPAPLSGINDPILMGHTVAETLGKRVHTLRQELAAKDAEIATLRKVAKVPASGPKVSEGGHSAPTHSGLRELLRDSNAFDALMRKAQMGILEDSDIPSLD